MSRYYRFARVRKALIKNPLDIKSRNAVLKVRAYVIASIKQPSNSRLCEMSVLGNGAPGYRELYNLQYLYFVHDIHMDPLKDRS